MVKQMNGKSKCQYKVYLACIGDNHNMIFVGVEPKLAESIVNNCFERCSFPWLIPTSFKSQTKIGNSIFDYSGIDNEGRKFILEIKSVPIA